VVGGPCGFYGLDEVSAAHLPPNVTGFVAHQSFRGMVDAARVLVPGLKRVAWVGDPPERSPYRRNYRQEIATVAAGLELIDLTGQAVTEVKKRVAGLPNDAVVLYTSIFVDGAGVVYTPQSALAEISGVTSRPIIADVESQLGCGAVGGFVFSLTSAAGRPCVLRRAFSTAKTPRRFRSPKSILIGRFSTGANSNAGTSRRTGCRREAKSGFVTRRHGSSTVGRSC
jgi:hypothetical protein